MINLGLNTTTSVNSELEIQLIALAHWALAQGARPLSLPHYTAQGDEVGAYLFQSRRFGPCLQAIEERQMIKLSDLIGMEAQKSAVVRNTQALLAGAPANNVLLTGARGTGKSSLIRALLNEFYDAGLRLIEVEKNTTDWAALHQVLHRALHHPPAPHRSRAFIVFADDLSFDDGEHGYKALKSILDGSLISLPAQVKIYATSNRRHLLPEYTQENLNTRHINEEIHPSEAVEEKISLSERFGLWLSFYPMEQSLYVNICAHWLAHFGCAMDENARAGALRFALLRGGRSGRVAEQFARDWAGQARLKSPH